MDLQNLVGENQSIKIVPSIEESLRSMGLNVDLDETADMWFSQLKRTWKTWKRSTALASTIVSFFQSVDDPHRVALALVIKCEDYKDCKPKTLPYCIIETLHEWSEKNSILPDGSLKLSAFNIAIKQRNQVFFCLIVKTYQLTTIKNEILPKIKEIIYEGDYKLATQIVIAMQLFEEIPVEDILFPLILQDKHNIIDTYLTAGPHQVKPFLSFLDKLLDKTFNIREFVQNFIESHNISDIKYDKLHYKPLGKVVARICNKFKIPIETCKNLSKNRTTGGLRYLIHQKYQEHNVSTSVWEDLVKDSLKQNAESALEFIDLLIDYDAQEALKWAKYLNMPESDYPPGLKQIPEKKVTEEKENWGSECDDSQEFYKLSLAQDKIIVVDTGEKFYNMMHSDLTNSKVVSIDCEWKPSFGATQSQVALIQIATYEEVYLIDTVILNKKEYSSFWYTFYKSLLDNAEIIKIGFGLEQDLREIKACIVGLNNIRVKGEGLLDLSILWKSLLTSGFVISSHSDIAGNSLSSLVQLCFGLPLAKSEQCSNWELRPLRMTQVQYAALDAHVLLEIYYYLQKACHNQGIKFDEICNDIMLEGKQKSSKKSKVVDRVKASVQNYFEMRPFHQIKFMVDPKLSNLLSYLRYCGIDTIIIPPTMLWHDVISLAISEDRLLLLSKIKHTPSLNYPQSHILDVGISSVKEQMRKILNNFKINMSDCKFLNRCIYCNEDDLRNITPIEVNNIYNEYVKPNRNKLCDDHDDENVNYDNFLSDSDCEDDLYQPAKVNLVKNSILTNKGIQIHCGDIDRLVATNKAAILCESCGQLLWDEEDLLKNARDLVENMTKLSVR